MLPTLSLAKITILRFNIHTEIILIQIIIPGCSVYRIVYLMNESTSGIEIKTLCAVILYSLAFGNEENITILLNANVLETIKYQLEDGNYLLVYLVLYFKINFYPFFI